MRYAYESDPDVSKAIDEAATILGKALTDKAPPVAREVGKFIPAEHLDLITESLVAMIAETIQAWIDAGSERDAVMENYELYDTIRAELRGWSNAVNADA
jgi:hypothetical protein